MNATLDIPKLPPPPKGLFPEAPPTLAIPVEVQYFELIGGAHEGRDENGNACYYRRGAMVPSVHDLAERWPEKFRRPSSVQVPSALEVRPGESHDQYTARIMVEVGKSLARAGMAVQNGATPGTVTATSIPASQMAPPASPQGPLVEPIRKLEATGSKYPDGVLQAMTFNDLKSVCNDEEIDISGMNSKAGLIDLIKKRFPAV